MKILQVGKFYHPTHGGIETVLKTLCEGLAHSGDQITVLCSAESPRTTIETINGVNVDRLGYFGRLFSQPLTPELPLRILALSGTYDIVHFHTPNPLAETTGLLLSHKIPYVVTYHADIVRQRILKPVYKPLLRTFLKRARRIVVPTSEHIEYSDFIHDLREQCAIIPFGINVEKLRPTTQSHSTAEALKLRYGRFALFVGRHVGYKGINFLIDAAAILRRESVDYKLLIAGDGPLRKELEHQAASLQLGDAVVFLGNISDTELKSYYEACETVVLPSLTKAEAFGMVLIEAMAVGKPVITTDIPSGVRSVNADGITGIQVPPANAAAIAKALRTLAEHKSRYEQMSNAARQRYESLYSAQTMVTSYRKLYEQILGN